MIIHTNSIVQHVTQIKNGVMKHVNVSVKIIVRTKKDYSCNPGTCVCESGKYLKSIADTSVIVCDEIINATDSLSTNMTNTIAIMS